MTPPEPLLDLIRRHSAQAPGPGLQRLRDALLARYGGAVQAILYYGSCLRSGNTLDGLVDLYVIVDGYRCAYRQPLLTLGNTLLPPNVFYLELPFEQTLIRAKYAVLSASDLRRGTGRWFHSYLWGRFAQPAALIYVRDAATAERLTAALAQAVITFIGRVLPCLPATFDAATLWQTGLTLSYGAELRTEKPGRAAQLVAAAPDYYEHVTAAALPALPYPVTPAGATVPPIYRIDIPWFRRRAGRFGWGLRRVQGKVLSLLRLIKALYTFRGGIDYLAWKLERHTGVPIEVTPALRRYPLLLVWGEMWRLYRRGVFR